MNLDLEESVRPSRVYKMQKKWRKKKAQVVPFLYKLWAIFPNKRSETWFLIKVALLITFVTLLIARIVILGLAEADAADYARVLIAKQYPEASVMENDHYVNIVRKKIKPGFLNFINITQWRQRAMSRDPELWDKAYTAYEKVGQVQGNFEDKLVSELKGEG